MANTTMILVNEVIIITAYDDFESIAAKKMERRDDAIARLGEIEVLIEDFHEKLIKLVNDDDIPKKYLDKIDSLQEKAKISAKKSNKSNPKRKILGPVALIICVSIGLLGFFWQDLGFAVPDWLISYKTFFL